MVRYGLLRGNHTERERRGHVRVQANLDVVLAGRLDVAGQLDAALVEVGTAGGLDRLLHLARGDRAEQPAPGARPGRQGDLEHLKLLLDLLGVPEVADLPSRAGPL